MHNLIFTHIPTLASTASKISLGVGDIQLSHRCLVLYYAVHEIVRDPDRN